MFIFQDFRCFVQCYVKPVFWNWQGGDIYLLYLWNNFHSPDVALTWKATFAFSTIFWDLLYFNDKVQKTFSLIKFSLLCRTWKCSFCWPFLNVSHKSNWAIPYICSSMDDALPVPKKDRRWEYTHHLTYNSL